MNENLDWIKYIFEKDNIEKVIEVQIEKTGIKK